MPKLKVLVTGYTDPAWLSELHDISEVHIWEEKESFLMPRFRLLRVIKDFDAVINFAEVAANKEFIFEAKKLKIIANISIGFDNLDLPLLSIYEIWATNAPGFFNYPVAEYVLAGVFALRRKLLEADDFIRRNEWKSFEPGRWDGTSLKFQTLGIVGMGSIGHELKKMTQSLGIKVVYFDRGHSGEEGSLSFDELISVSDIISIHVPLNTSTRNLFNKEVIHKMKRGAILVNTSRGNIIDENALIEALETGHLSGAILDVFANEPTVPEKLKLMKNVLLTPHMAGGTLHGREGCVRCAATNVVQVLTGNVPQNALNNPLDAN
jgi:glyoxylate reductase